MPAFFSVQIEESILHAKMEYECRLRGAEILAYPPVVAGKVKYSAEFESDCGLF